jgi:hypothetical protein
VHLLAGSGTEKGGTGGNRGRSTCGSASWKEETGHTVEAITGLGEYAETIDSYLPVETRALGATGQTDRYSRERRLDDNGPAAGPTRGRKGIPDHHYAEIEDSTRSARGHYTWETWKDVESGRSEEGRISGHRISPMTCWNTPVACWRSQSWKC